VEDALARQVYAQVADLLNLEVDLLFFDITCTYFELDEPDEPLPCDDRGHVATPPTVAADADGACGGTAEGRRAGVVPPLRQVRPTGWLVASPVRTGSGRWRLAVSRRGPFPESL
jgi:hypothetical protein